MLNKFNTPAMLLLSLLSLYTLVPTVSAEISCTDDETPVAFHTTDVLFLIDSSSSMCSYSAAVAEGMAKFVAKLEDSGIDSHYAVVSFGGPPAIRQKFTVFHKVPFNLSSD
jgi:hypothetical protein